MTEIEQETIDNLYDKLDKTRKDYKQLKEMFDTLNRTYQELVCEHRSLKQKLVESGEEIEISRGNIIIYTGKVIFK